MNQKKAIIIGAGPAGLTAAYELAKRSTIKPIVFEKSDSVGGISKTVNYKGNRIDIGGHRFFSKSDRVMEWWLNIMPLQKIGNNEIKISYHNKNTLIQAKGEIDPELHDCVMLLRKRKSRIYYNRTFFDYPLKLNVSTIRKLGLVTTFNIAVSYFKSMIFPIKKEKNLEDFFINRFGRRLYETFFKSYTEKVWGVSCNQISPEWGAQRIKGFSIRAALKHGIKQFFFKKVRDLSQKNIETTLIEQFLYPKYGPGHMWQEVAHHVEKNKGVIEKNAIVEKVFVNNRKITAVQIRNTVTNQTGYIEADYFFSTMPIKELINALTIEVPKEIKEISDGLQYRDFITVGLLVNRLTLIDRKESYISDNWIYIQEHDVLVGRLQIFNNWSPYMVNDSTKIWLGLEYFCYETDELWKKSNEELILLAREELHKIGIINKEDVLDSTVIRVEKTYPAYFGTYKDFAKLRKYLDHFENLFLIGRNGMHKYNNQDHSMLTAMTAVDNICAGIVDKSNIWAVNTEQEYHETKK